MLWLYIRFEGVTNMTKPILRENDIGLMKIDELNYIVLAKDEKRLGVQLYKTQSLNTQTMWYGLTQYALPSFEIALQSFNHRIHIDYKKMFDQSKSELEYYKKYITEKMEHYIGLLEDQELTIEDLEEI